MTCNVLVISSLVRAVCITRHKVFTSVLALSLSLPWLSQYQGQKVGGTTQLSFCSCLISHNQVHYSFLQEKKASISSYFIFLSSASVSPMSFYTFWEWLEVFLCDFGVGLVLSGWLVLFDDFLFVVIGGISCNLN